jgi:uncharacterized protein (TIGR02246 family)
MILLLAAGVTILFSRRQVSDNAAVVAPTNPEPPTPSHPNRQADKAAIEKLAQEFVKAFNQGNAKAIASIYRAEGEYYDEKTVEPFHGRAEIEKAYANLFRERRGSTIELKDPAIRFLSHDSALQEGVLQSKTAGSETPERTRFSSHWLREAGAWQIALTREWRVD